MDTRSKIILICFALAVTASIAVCYQRYIVKDDFAVITNEDGPVTGEEE